MKHWDGRDRDQAVPLRLSHRDRQRYARFFETPARPRRESPDMGSVIGLVLAVCVLVGVAWMLAPGEPVSPNVLK